MVEGTIDGFPFRTPLESGDRGAHALKISQALRAALGTEAGEEVVFALDVGGASTSPFTNSQGAFNTSGNVDNLKAGRAQSGIKDGRYEIAMLSHHGFTLHDCRHLGQRADAV